MSRVENLAEMVENWIGANLPEAFSKNVGLKFKAGYLLLLPSQAVCEYPEISDPGHTQRLDNKIVEAIKDLQTVGVDNQVIKEMIKISFSYEEVTDPIPPRTLEFLKEMC